MILFCISLASIDDLLLKKSQLYSMQANNPENFSPGWYYFYIKRKSFLRSLNLTIKSTNLITNRWTSIFLDSSKLGQILSNSSYRIIPERYFSTAQILSIPDTDLYLIESHTDHIPSNSEKFYENFYISNFYPKDNEFIRSVTILPRIQLLNRWTKGVVQSDNFNLHFEDEIRLVPYQPFFSHGIRGQGEIVTIIDSGIDHRHCFYHDPNVSVPFDHTNFEHRKIVRYQVISDQFDGENGHGTHVSGIIAGKSHCVNCSSSMYNGIAPDAKIFFIDAGEEKDPISLTQRYSFSSIVDIAKGMNSHVFSNSWGFPSSTKKVRQMFDRIAFNNPFMSFIFGTGNSRHFFDIFTPANSKNVISVGNIEIDQLRRYKGGFHDIFLLKSEKTKKNYKIKNLNCSKSLLNEITFSDNLRSYQKMKVIKYDKGINDYNNSFVYMNLNLTCKKIHDLENKKILILFIKNSIFLNCSNHSSLPIFSISKSLSEYETVSIVTSVNYSGFNDDVSFINSYGPTKNGLLKPEIFAPGNETVSARGANSHKPPHDCNNKDGLIKKSGTSMSTPAVAGAVILLIQYFRDGFYPTCQKNLSNSMKISSTLVRAILVNSASYIKNMNFSKRPLLNSGFGSIHLANSLLLDQNLTENGFRFCDRQKITSKSDIFTTIKIDRCINMSPLKVTLTWLDPPLDSKSKMPLFADLDLYLVTPSQKVVYGNNYEYEDSHSTTEKIIIDQPDEGEYQVHVYCHKLPIENSEIFFSVAINGPFNHLDFDRNKKNLVFSQTKSCIACRGKKCQSEIGKCICYDNQTGIHCSSRVYFVRSQTSRFQLESRKPFYLFCQIPENLTRTQFVRIQFSFFDSLLVHMSVGINQVPKFGGKFLNFVVMKSKMSFDIDPKEDDKFKRGSLIYFDLYEATKKNPVLFVNLSIVESLEIDESDSQNISATAEASATVKGKSLFLRKNYLMIAFLLFVVVISFLWVSKKRKCSVKKIKMKLFDYERLP